MKILVTGSTGLVGSSLVPFLLTGGHDVIRLVRRAPTNDSEIQWEPDTGKIDLKDVGDLDAAVHLAGESIADRWSRKKKSKIRDSRIQGTQLLASAVAQLENQRTVFVSASAIGFYGNRGNEVLTEESRPGNDFLSSVCQSWENATQPLEEKEIRTVHLRFGVILSPKGGALAKMLPAFQLGQGANLGSGRQYMSWIGISDAVGTIYHAIMTKELRGPVNVVGPNPVTNADFTKTMGRVLKRPTVVPGILGKLTTLILFGDMATALLFTSQRVTPDKLVGTGYQFRHADLELALRHVLGRQTG